MALRWQPSMSVGVSEFDEDHKRMMGLISSIAAALAEGAHTRRFVLTNDLLALAIDHTTREEAFLRRIGFPRVEDVVAVQKDSFLRISALKEAAPDEAGGQIAELEDAFVAYLLRADINYKSFVEAAGLSDTGRRW